MFYSYSSFFRAKTRDDCEDAFASSVDQQNGVLSDSPVRFAIADGVSNTESSGGWAQLLSKAFCDGGEEKLCSNIVRLGDSWVGNLFEYYCELIPQLQEMGLKYPNPTLTQHRNRVCNPDDTSEYPSATLLGFEIHPKEKKWRVISVGDACLFHIRGSECIKSHPLNDASAFGSFPHQISTNIIPPIGPNTKEETIRNIEKNVSTYLLGVTANADGDFEDGDVFFLMTDKLSEWFLRGGVDAAKIQTLLNIKTNEEFNKFGREVVYEECGVDDLTLTTIKLSNSELPPAQELPKLPSRIKLPPDIPVIGLRNHQYFAGDKIPIILTNSPVPLKQELINLGADKNDSERTEYKWYMDGKEIPENKTSVKTTPGNIINVGIQIDSLGKHEIWVELRKKCGAFESNHRDIEVLERPERTQSQGKKKHHRKGGENTVKGKKAGGRHN